MFYGLFSFSLLRIFRFWLYSIFLLCCGATIPIGNAYKSSCGRNLFFYSHKIKIGKHTLTLHTQTTGYPVVNDPLYNHEVFGPLKGRGGDIGGKTDEQLVRDLINIHNAENWLGIDGDSELSLFKTMKTDSDDGLSSLTGKGKWIEINVCYKIR